MRTSLFSEFVSAVRIAVLFLIFVCSAYGIAQKDKEQHRLLKESQKYLSEASEKLQKNNFPTAEADYRKAIALNPVDETGKYNLGNAYYNKTLNAEAMRRFKEAATVAVNKPEKHKAFHNLGNTFMNAKQYKEAVEAYKNALRNNPTDDETRYNFALAKKMLEEEQKNGGGDDNKDQNQENKDQDKENKEDKGDEQEGDKGDEKEDKDKGDQKDENKDGDKEKDKGKPDEKKEEEGDKEKQQQQPVPGQLSPQQIKNLLEAMNNEEKKVQDKINAKKQKGAQVKSNKDW
ncbi:tetratricopeptide repeat protein [Altibacter sp.]|uniref:tetratricopeptide repeat protein n=1 Tax=Altibacter sp. TaxID=2024823 RepID=UPI0034325F59